MFELITLVLTLKAEGISQVFKEPSETSYKYLINYDLTNTVGGQRERKGGRLIGISELLRQQIYLS